MAKKKPTTSTRVRHLAKRLKAQALPGMEDHAIRPLEAIATKYADIRDRRMELTRDEHTLKANALVLMKKYGKTHYAHAGVVIDVVQGDETVKVKIQKPHADADDFVEAVTFDGKQRAAGEADDAEA